MVVSLALRREERSQEKLKSIFTPKNAKLSPNQLLFALLQGLWARSPRPIATPRHPESPVPLPTAFPPGILITFQAVYRNLVWHVENEGLLSSTSRRK
jgi:hypothetical protein